MWRIARWVVLTGLIVTGVVVGRQAWDGSDALRRELLRPHPPPEVTVTVVDLGDGVVTLARTSPAQADGVWGLRWRGGYGRIGRVLAVTGDTVTRPFEAILGELPVGEDVVLEEHAYPFDPLAAHAFAVGSVRIPGEFGDFPAWRLDGEGPVWVIVLHGLGVEERHQAHRILPTLEGLGLPALVITYRTDFAAPAGAEPRYHWGLTEWADLERAVLYARRNGAEEFVLVGYGMGASIGSVFLRESPQANGVVGFVMDSPVLDLEATADRVAGSLGIPAYVRSAARALTAFRFDLRWSDLDNVEKSGSFSAPILLFHGTGDDTAPVEVSDEFAATRPDLVSYHRVQGALHQAVWNADPEGYEEALTAFLLEVLAPDADS